MAVYMWNFEGWTGAGTDTVVRRYDLDASTWVITGFAAAPTNATLTSANGNTKQQGGWDGTYWYAICTDGKLYRYDPTANTWSSALNGGTVVIGGTVEDQHWVMTSDGRFIYILDSNSGFRRYNPATDTLTALSAPGGTYNARMFLAYDGNDTIYGTGGGTAGNLSKFVISTGVWTALAANSTISSEAPVTIIAAYLQGYLWLCYYATTYKVQRYDPGGNSYTTKGTHAGYGNEVHHIMGCEKTDGQIQLWISNFNSAIYDIAGDSWSSAVIESFSGGLRLQGFNWAVTRSFAGAFTWYQSDGTTLLTTTEDEGTLIASSVTTFHYKLKTLAAAASGVTVSVPSQAGTDAEDVVLVCETSGGTYATSFNHSGALAANDVIDVYVKVSPTYAQALGLLKLYNLQAVAN